MNIYRHLNYRVALDEIVETRRKLPGKFTLRALAEEAGLQPSFLTNVLKGRFDFNADQLYAICSALDLPIGQREYLALLLEYERSVFKPRKEELRARIEDLRRENQKSEKHIDVKSVELTSDAHASYYLDPFAQLVLVYLNMPPYDRHPEKLGVVLGLSQSHLGEILKLLLRLDFVAQAGGAYKVLARNRHLPKTNPISGPHLTMMRLKAIDQMQRLSPEQAYAHSVTFTGTEDTREALIHAYLEFLKKAEAAVKPARSEKVFQMNFDLFPWEI